MTSGFSTQQEVISEATALLRGLCVSTSHGVTLAGDHAHILLSSSRNEDAGTYSLLLTCYPLGRQQMDWGGLPVLVAPAESGNVPAKVARISHRGQAIIPDLPEGSYRLSVAECWFYSDEGIIAPTFQAEGQPESLAAADQKPEVGWPELPAEYISSDARVVVIPEVPAAGVIALTFESSDAALDGASVRFAIVRPRGEVVISDVVELTPVAGRSTRRGRWEGKITVTEPCHLMFEVFPAS